MTTCRKRESEHVKGVTAPQEDMQYLVSQPWQWRGIAARFKYI
jgi:hypothetical protein